jgi:Kdo2-lipid IVA lauroyltransferase/acyltransferase
MRRLLHLLELGVVTLVEGVARTLTGPSVGRAARALGRGWYALDRRRRDRALENLRVAFPALSFEARRRLARASMGHLLQVPLEVMTSARFLPDVASLERRVRVFGDYEAFRADVHRGRGGLVVAAHLGSWEVAARALLLTGVPARAVMRPLENPYLNRRIVSARGGDRRVIGKHGAARQVVSTLEEGRWAALLADQNAGRHGAFVPFFGLPACTHTLPATLALRLGLPLYVSACLRSPRGPWTFDLHFRRLLPGREPGAGPVPGDPGALDVLARMNAAIEGWVRLAPEQYNWVHRRWRTRPPGEVPGPHLPDYARGVPPRPPEPRSDDDASQVVSSL